MTEKLPLFYAGSEVNFMAKINNKAVKTIAKLLEEGFTTEKDILAMTMDDILLMPGISLAEVSMINNLQKAIKANKVISYLGGDEKNE